MTGPLSLRFGNRPDKAPPTRTYTATHSTPGTTSPLHSIAPFHQPRLRSAYRFGSRRSVLPDITIAMAITIRSAPSITEWPRNNEATAVFVPKATGHEIVRFDMSHGIRDNFSTHACGVDNKPRIHESTNGMTHLRRDKRPGNGALTGPLSLRCGNRPDKAPHRRTYTARHPTPGTASPLHSVTPSTPATPFRLPIRFRALSASSHQQSHVDPSPVAFSPHCMASHSRCKP